MNHRYILVYDFETDSRDPYTTNPVELACVPIEPRNLKILDNEVFKITIRPPEINDEDYFENHSDTIHFHAKNHNCQPQEIIQKWKQGIDQKIALEEFNYYCKQFNIERTNQHYWTDPIPAGHNITGFDNIIFKNVYEKHKLTLPFSFINQIDTLHWLFTWFENLSQPNSLSLDNLRLFLGLSSNGVAHEASTDVLDTAKIIVKFLTFQRAQARVDKFKGAFNESLRAS